MSVQTKIGGFVHLPFARKPDAQTVAWAKGFARLMQGVFDLSAYDAGLDHDVNIKVWGTRPDGYKIEVTVYWDGFVDIHTYAQDGVSGITGLDIAEAQTHLYTMHKNTVGQ